MLWFSNEQIIASIVGILATFVVISNIAQVQNAKQECVDAVEEAQQANENLHNTAKFLLEKTPEYIASKRLIAELDKKYDERSIWVLAGVLSEDDNRLEEVMVYIENIVLDKDNNPVISFFDKDKKKFTSRFSTNYYLTIRDIFEDANFRLQEQSYLFVLRTLLEKRNL